MYRLAVGKLRKLDVGIKGQEERIDFFDAVVMGEGDADNAIDGVDFELLA